MIKVQVFTFKDIVLPILYGSVFFGILHEFLDILNLQVWVVWFLLHLALLSVFIIYNDLSFIQVTASDRKHIFYNILLLVLWYYQKVYALIYYPSGNFDPNCKRDLLVLNFSLVWTLIVVAAGAAFVGLVRW